jgi:hypothetical protein
MTDSITIAASEADALIVGHRLKVEAIRLTGHPCDLDRLP